MMTGPRNYGESLNLDILQIHPVSVQSNTKKKGYSLVRDTGSQCFTVLHSPLLFLVLSLLASYPLVRLAHCLLYGIARFIDAHSHNVSIHTPPIFISLIYLVCTNFPGIGRNQKERKNIHRLHASMAWRGNWHSWIHARGIM